MLAGKGGERLGLIRLEGLAASRWWRRVGEKARQDGGFGGVGTRRCERGERGFGGGGDERAALAAAPAPAAAVAGAVVAVAVAAGAGMGSMMTPLGGRPHVAGDGDKLSSDEDAV